MEMIPVSSSNIQSVGYDSTTETLRVEFLNGSIYEYKAVPQAVHDELINAPSCGSYFNRNIRNNYAHERIA